MEHETFQVTVKGLVFDRGGRVMLLREPSGVWDLPGGRLRHGESFEECLRRECEEEMGVGCTVLEKTPRCAWTALDKLGNWRLMLCFAIELEHFQFRDSEECVGYDFIARESLDSVDLSPQTRPLRAWL